jgi:hypothetical protein
MFFWVACLPAADMRLFLRARRCLLLTSCLASEFVCGVADASLATPAAVVAPAGPSFASTASTKTRGRRKRGKRRTRGSSREPGRSRRHKRHVHSGLASNVGAIPPVLAPSPGPARTIEAERAMDNARRLQIERAANAARRENLTNRWQTVLFLVSGVDEQRYPDAGFWKVVAYYRGGRVSEGDTTRQRCRLSADDVRALDTERAVATTLAARHGGASGIQTASFGLALADNTEVVGNDAPYAGPSPASAR